MLLSIYAAHFPPSSPPPSALRQLCLALSLFVMARFWIWLLLTSPSLPLSQSWLLKAGAQGGAAAYQESARALASLFHSLLVLPALFKALRGVYPISDLAPKHPLAEEAALAPRDSRRLQACLTFTSAYMLVDSLLLLREKPAPELLEFQTLQFLLHHLATLLYMGLVFRARAGQLACAMLIFFGELTNPLHNVHDLVMAAVERDKAEGVETPERARLYAQALLYV